MKDQIVTLDKNKTPQTALLHTNEDATNYFMEIKIKGKGVVKLGLQNRKNLMKKLNSSKTKDSINQDFQLF